MSASSSPLRLTPPAPITKWSSDGRAGDGDAIGRPELERGDDLDLRGADRFGCGEAGAEGTVGEVDHRRLVAGAAGDHDRVRIGHGGPTRARDVVEGQHAGGVPGHGRRLVGDQGDGRRGAGRARGRTGDCRSGKSRGHDRAKSKTAPPHPVADDAARIGGASAARPMRQAHRIIRRSLGSVISGLARRGLTTPRVNVEDGLPVIRVPAGTPAITPAMVRRGRDDH